MARTDDDGIFGSRFLCDCGKEHHIYPLKAVYSDHAISRLPELAETFHLGPRVALLADERTFEAAGKKASGILTGTGFEVQLIMVEEGENGHEPKCDDLTRDVLDSKIGEVDWMLPVGSGVISDLGKWLSYDRNIPYLCVATAASMNGYASSNTAPTINGIKCIGYARAPLAVMAEPAILQNAPYEMTTAGLGDVIAKPVSSADWFLNNQLFGDYYCNRSVQLVEDIEPLYLNHSEKLKHGDTKAMEALFHALLLTGVSMNMADTSAPASGAEHLISHSLDMTSSVLGIPHDLHGRQVGIGTVIAAEVYRRVLAVENPVFSDPLEDVDTVFWGPLGQSIKENYAEKLPRLRLIKDRLSKVEAWDNLRGKLSNMLRSPEVLQNCLARAGGALHADEILCSRTRLLEIFRRAHTIRSRVTVFDLAHLMGILPSAANEIVDRWA